MELLRDCLVGFVLEKRVGEFLIGLLQASCCILLRSQGKVPSKRRRTFLDGEAVFAGASQVVEDGSRLSIGVVSRHVFESLRVSPLAVLFGLGMELFMGWGDSSSGPHKSAHVSTALEDTDWKLGQKQINNEYVLGQR